VLTIVILVGVGISSLWHSQVFACVLCAYACVVCKGRPWVSCRLGNSKIFEHVSDD
jgi:hypothetical protein